MYGIFTYKYTIHGSYGHGLSNRMTMPGSSRHMSRLASDRREEPCERQREQQLQSLAAKEGIQVSLDKTDDWILMDIG